MEQIGILEIAGGVFLGNFLFWFFSTGMRTWEKEENAGLPDRLGTMAMVAFPLLMGIFALIAYT